MNNNQEILCNKCVHYEVCTYKDDYFTILKTISNVEFSDKTIKDFDFIKDIKVECKFYQNKEFYGTK